MNKQSIDIFLSIVREGSISGAAQKLHFSQPTVAEYLIQLEKALGVRLVMREHSSRHVRLTPSWGSVYASGTPLSKTPRFFQRFTHKKKHALLKKNNSR